MKLFDRITGEIMNQPAVRVAGEMVQFTTRYGCTNPEVVLSVGLVKVVDEMEEFVRSEEIERRKTAVAAV